MYLYYIITHLVWFIERLLVEFKGPFDPFVDLSTSSFHSEGNEATKQTGSYISNYLKVVTPL